MKRERRERKRATNGRVRDTRISAHGDLPSVAVWFETIRGRVSIRMSADGLFLLQNVVSDAINRLPVDSGAATGEEDSTEAETRDGNGRQI
ncbi:MAG: hypothetical protein AABO41_07625 [Acidobacteriota bacterium]